MKNRIIICLWLLIFVLGLEHDLYGREDDSKALEVFFEFRNQFQIFSDKTSSDKKGAHFELLKLFQYGSYIPLNFKQKRNLELTSDSKLQLELYLLEFEKNCINSVVKIEDHELLECNIEKENVIIGFKQKIDCGSSQHFGNYKMTISTKTYKITELTLVEIYIDCNHVNKIIRRKEEEEKKVQYLINQVQSAEKSNDFETAIKHLEQVISFLEPQSLLKVEKENKLEYFYSKNEFNNDLRIADQLFIQRKYEEAANKYDFALQIYNDPPSRYWQKSDSSEVAQRILLCKALQKKMEDPCFANQDSIQLLLNESSLAFDQLKYEETQQRLSWVFGTCPSTKTDERKKILQECNQMIYRKKLINLGDLEMNSSNYKKAIDLFTQAKVIKQDADLSNKIYEAKDKLELKQNLILAKKHIKTGDYYFNKEFFKKALQYYEEAVQYRLPTEWNQKIKQKIAISKSSSSAKMQRDLSTGRVYLKQGKLADALVLLTKYEFSGELSSKDLFWMGEILNIGYANVRKKLGYTKRQAFNKASEYIRQSKNMGNQDALVTWNLKMKPKERQIKK